MSDMDYLRIQDELAHMSEILKELESKARIAVKEAVEAISAEQIEEIRKKIRLA